ncbi:MAG TPA: hypothetical protein VFA70_09915 [Dehalococcoidia bacterium]|nr:hypothetical protein [Dehalococcoidia bacterium]
MRLPIIKRGRDARPAGEERYALEAEMPGRSADRPLWRIKIEVQRRPQGAGNSLRLRAHLQVRPAQALGLETALGEQAARREPAGPRGLARTRVRRWAAPFLQQEFNHWLELRASTADLAHGAGELLPEAARLRELGVEPHSGEGPAVQTWVGHSGRSSQPGYAQVSLVQLDKCQLPRVLARLLGARPFQLAAALVSVIEPQHMPPRE